MEETSIPDELTYHEPAPHHAGEPRDALFMTARIVSLIFTPFMVPFVAFCLLFFFTYLCSKVSPTQTIGFKPSFSEAFNFKLTVSSVSLKYCLLSECPIITYSTLMHFSISCRTMLNQKLF